jgi:hypothetical protein
VLLLELSLVPVWSPRAPFPSGFLPSACVRLMGAPGLQGNHSTSLSLLVKLLPFGLACPSGGRWNLPLQLSRAPHCLNVLGL